MLLIANPTRPEHKAEQALLFKLRQTALSAGSQISESHRVQIRIAELLSYLRKNNPTLQFRERYIYRAGLLGEGLVMRVDAGMDMVTIRRVTADNVVSLHKITTAVTVGGVQ